MPRTLVQPVSRPAPRPEATAREVAHDVGELLAYSLGFVTALAWNAAFQSLFETVDWLRSAGPWVYAVILTGFHLLFLRVRKRCLRN